MDWRGAHEHQGSLSPLRHYARGRNSAQGHGRMRWSSLRHDKEALSLSGKLCLKSASSKALGKFCFSGEPMYETYIGLLVTFVRPGDYNYLGES
jgi:hypothetical protein